ncbi:hypothetical protein [Hephaestia caeni]|uniref:hypothetical protein n=1 Tax=Hephaestia caeni TaxID=645617 RepID=UPI001FE6412F|nr:hypothetical protein [Hephaestia caeni]
MNEPADLAGGKIADALRHADMTNFVTQAALREADAMIAKSRENRAFGAGLQEGF